MGKSGSGSEGDTSYPVQLGLRHKAVHRLTTIMTLVAESKLSLDEPANRFLAGCKLVGKDRNAEAVSVRLLGAHASGLPGIYESYDANEAKLVPSPDALLQQYGRLAYPPAACYEYSNLGFAALNAIALALTQIGAWSPDASKSARASRFERQLFRQ